MLFVYSVSGIIFLIINVISFLVFKASSIAFLTILTLSIAFLIALYTYFFIKKVLNPIKLTITTLKDRNDTNISKLKKVSSEFSEIGNLSMTNSLQQKELEKAKEKAEESKNLKASFLTNLSHEIRTPMNAILGFTDLLSSEELGIIKQREYINIIRRSGKNLVSIIDDLIEMSKIDTQQVKPKYDSFDLDSTLANIKKTIEITINKTEPLNLILDKPKHPVVYQLISDETKFKQIMVNLINNAIKYTEKGSVNFGYKISPEDNQLEFYVSDTGIGISEEEHKNIFNRFNRIQNDKTIKQSGLGLGLSISKAYVEMLGGKIWLKSNDIVGTTFHFTIPLKLSALSIIETKKEIKPNEPHKAKPLTILVAEDNRVNFMLIKHILKARNYKIIHASNGKEAVSICRENNNIQVVIMDIKMPVMDGFEARKLIKKFKPLLPVIAHTAYTSDEIENEIYEAGFINYISKPLDKIELFKIIDRIEHLTPNPVSKASI